MAGAATLEAIGPALQGLLYDRETRGAPDRRPTDFIDRYGLGRTGAPRAGRPI